MESVVDARGRMWLLDFPALTFSDQPTPHAPFTARWQQFASSGGAGTPPPAPFPQKGAAAGVPGGGGEEGEEGVAGGCAHRCRQQEGQAAQQQRARQQRPLSGSSGLCQLPGHQLAREVLTRMTHAGHLTNSSGSSMLLYGLRLPLGSPLTASLLVIGMSRRPPSCVPAGRHRALCHSVGRHQAACSYPVASVAVQGPRVEAVQV